MYTYGSVTMVTIKLYVTLQACKKQVAVLSEFKTSPIKSLEKYLDFKFDESSRITVDVEMTTVDTTGWDILNKTNEVSCSAKRMYSIYLSVCFNKLIYNPTSIIHDEGEIG